MIPVIYVQFFVAVVWGFLAREWVTHIDDEPVALLGLYGLLVLAILGWSLGPIGGRYA